MGERTVQEAYEEGFYDARQSILELIEEFYNTYKDTIDTIPPKVVLSVLGQAIVEADVLNME